MKKKIIAFSFIFIMCFSCFLFSACKSKGLNFIPDEVSFPFATGELVPRLISIKESENAVDIVKQVKPAVVGVYVENSTGGSLGSGVSIEKGGYILTNSHVVGSGRTAKIFLVNNKATSGEVIWKDESIDLAIIKSKIDLPYLKMGKRNEYSVGETILAIGTPLSLQFKHTVTKGIISAVNRTVQVGGGFSSLQNLIQHDASINPGNSGGPLINLKGEVIGINTLKVQSAEGIAFAIPVDVISPIIKRVSKNVTNEEVEFVKLGILGYDAFVEFYEGKTSEVRGVYVKRIERNSLLQNSGLKVKDVIIGVDGKNIENVLDLRLILSEKKYGEIIKIKYKSAGKTKEEEILLKKSQV